MRIRQVLGKRCYDLRSTTVLIVEDNRFMQRLTVAVLKGLGVGQIAEASDGAQAMHLLEHMKPDFVVTDLTMSPMDGVDFVRKVRRSAEPINPLVPIIMMTAHSQIDLVCAARDAGVTEVLAKPISPRSVAGRIAEIVERPRPFIRTPDFFGPDRRRRKTDEMDSPRRRATDQPPSDELELLCDTALT